MFRKAKTCLSRLLALFAAGEQVVNPESGRPVADLVPRRSTSVVFGGLKGELSYDDSTFEEPDSDIQQMFYGDADATS